MNRRTFLTALSALPPVGCYFGPPAPQHGVIVDVYREVKIGMPDGTTVVKMPDGSLRKYHGRLGKAGDSINVAGLSPVNF